MVSRANTYVGLTHAGAGTAAAEPERYFPTGTRAFARVIGADDAQGVTLARAREETRRATPIPPARTTMATAGRSQSTRPPPPTSSGSRVVATAAWDPEAFDDATLASKVERTPPDAVVLGGCVCENGLSLLETRRKTLDPRTNLLAPDAFMRGEERYSEIAKAAQGLYVNECGNVS